ncbi:MAG: O-antigen ligase family protein [Verrucomicrobiota bacterium]
MIVTIYIVLILVGLLLPGRYAAAGMPALWVLFNMGVPPDEALASAGLMNIRGMDLMTMILFGKFILRVLREREMPYDRLLYSAICIFLAVNLTASLAAGLKLGDAQLMRGLTSLMRFSSEIMILPIIAQFIRTEAEARTCVWIVLGLLIALALIQFIDFFGVNHGITIGEVQGLERKPPRFFGPVGDSIGTILLLGYVTSLCFGRWVGAALFCGGILLTLGLNAVFITFMGTLFFLPFAMRSALFKESIRRNLWALPLVGTAVIIFGVLFVGPMTGPLRNRLSSGSAASSGIQRMASATMAGRIIADNPVLGVGYMGFQSALEHYGGGEYFNLNRQDGATANTNNQLLQILTDSGIAGLAAYLFLMFAAARLFWSIATRWEDPFLKTFYLGAFIWLITQVFGNQAAVWLVPSSYFSRILWILLGIAIAIEQRVPKKASTETGVPQAATL